MQREAKYAAELVASFLYNNLPRLRVDQFKNELQAIFLNKLKLSIDAFSDPNMDVFYSKNVRKFRLVSSTDTDEGILATAVKNSYLDLSEVLTYLDKTDFTVWIQHGQVTYKLGRDDEPSIYFKCDESKPISSSSLEDFSNIMRNNCHKSSSHNSLSELDDLSPDSPTKLINAITKAIIEKQSFNDEYDLLKLRCTSPSQLSASDSSGYASSCSTLNGQSARTPEQIHQRSNQWFTGASAASNQASFTNNQFTNSSPFLQCNNMPANPVYANGIGGNTNNLPFMTAGMFAQTKFGTTKLRNQMNSPYANPYAYNTNNCNSGAAPAMSGKYQQQYANNYNQQESGQLNDSTNNNMLKPNKNSFFENCAQNYPCNLNKPLLVWNKD